MEGAFICQSVLGGCVLEDVFSGGYVQLRSFTEKKRQHKGEICPCAVNIVPGVKLN